MKATKDDFFTAPTREVTIDLSGLYPRQIGDSLTLEIPALPFPEPVLRESTVETMLAAGLEQRDVDDAVEDMILSLEVKLLAQMFAKRMR